jgi:hypothetical protein
VPAEAAEEVLVDSVTYARKALEQSFGLFNTIADGMTDEQYNWQPGGTCNAIAKSHVHAMTSVDFFINGTLKGAQMEWPAFATANGLPANPMEIWGYSGAIPLAPMKEYGQKVQKSALEYAASLNESDLDREIDTPFFGKQTAAFILMLTGMHAIGHGGDMSAVKGIQGLKGLPF